MYDTFELGPILNAQVQDFSLPDHKKVRYSLKDIMGASGLLLGFIGDIWRPASVRRILWLQRHVQKLTLMGAPVSLVIREDSLMLDGFQSSSPLPVPFPLLADSDGEVHKTFTMDRHPGMLLIDRHFVLREKWLVPDERVWPKLQDITRAVRNIQA